jgi:intracellular sulfur oxidation DsrE/DsrF family protein
LPARQGARAGALRELDTGGVKVLADRFSLRERAIAADQLAPGIEAAELDIVIDQMASGAKTLWH